MNSFTMACLIVISDIHNDALLAAGSLLLLLLLLLLPAAALLQGHRMPPWYELQQLPQDLNWPLQGAAVSRM